MHLSISDQDMLARLLDFCLEHQVALVCSSDGLDHFGKFARNQRLDGDSDGWLGPEFERNHNIDLPPLRQFCMSNGGCLCDCLVNTFHQYQISCCHCWYLDSIPTLKYIQFGHISYK